MTCIQTDLKHTMQDNQTDKKHTTKTLDALHMLSSFWQDKSVSWPIYIYIYIFSTKIYIYFSFYWTFVLYFSFFLFFNHVQICETTP